MSKAMDTATSQPNELVRIPRTPHAPRILRIAQRP